MLKELYNKSIDKYSPDENLLESTKNAMYNAIAAPDSIADIKTNIEMKNSGKPNCKVQNRKRLVACCAAFALVVSVSAICTLALGRENNEDKQDPFASSDHLAFEGDSPNDGKEPSQYFSTQSNAISTLCTTQTDYAVTVKPTTTPNTENQPLQTQISQTSLSTQKTDVTSFSQTQITTTTTSTEAEPSAPFEADFGYYDPQYDPAFEDEFDRNKGEEFLFEYDNIYYYFDCFKSDRVMLQIDGQSVSLRKAIDDNLIEPCDLLEFDGFICKGYYNDEHNEPIDIHPSGGEQLQESGGFMNCEPDDDMPFDRESREHAQDEEEPIW